MQANQQRGADDVSRRAAEIYQGILDSAFEKIKKNLPRKYANLKDFITQIGVRVAEDVSQQELNANTYYVVFKIAINMRTSKITEIALRAVEELIRNGFLDGNCVDRTQEYAKNEELAELLLQGSPKGNNEKGKSILLIEGLISDVASCIYEREESIQIAAIKIMYALGTTLAGTCHNNALRQLVICLAQLTGIAKSVQIEKLAKSSLQQIVNLYFGTQTGEGAAPVQANGAAAQSSTATLGSSPGKSKGQSLTNTSFAQSAEDGILKSGSQNGIESVQSGFAAQVCAETLRHVVDDVVLYSARTQRLIKQLQEVGVVDEAVIAQELRSIPLRSVPLQLDNNDICYRRVIQVPGLKNGQGEAAGNFGWCLNCKKTAQYYCRERRVPVCSLACKRAYGDRLERAARIEQEEVQARIQFQRDAVTVFRVLCNLLGSDESDEVASASAATAFSLQIMYILATNYLIYIQYSQSQGNGAAGNSSEIRIKLFILEIVRALCERPNAAMRQADVLNVMREGLCDSLLRCCLRSEKQVVQQSFGVFLHLVREFKSHLKIEIAIFLNEIFLKLLVTPNASFQHRHLSLQVVRDVLQRQRNVLEFYINYDCSFEHEPLVEKMVEVLEKIAKGLFQAPEYQAQMQLNQEPELRQLAIQTTCLLVRSVMSFYDKYESDREKKAVAFRAQQEMAAQAEKNLRMPDESIVLPADSEIVEDMYASIGKDKSSVSSGGNSQPRQQVTSSSQLDVAPFQSPPPAPEDPMQKQRQMKIDVARAVKKFNHKPSHGLKELRASGLVQNDDPKQIALFLRSNRDLDKDKIGEFIGGHLELNIKVLSEFTDLLDFTGMPVDEAMRYFLEQFTLLGESQIVDRIVQKFGQKYQQDNQNAFNSSDGVYVLSYLMIMLQTDAYNPQVQKKMSLEEFTRLAKGIEGENFTVDFITSIYHSILRRPLAISQKQRQQEEQQRMHANSLRKKQNLFDAETKEMLQKGKQLFRQSSDRTTQKEFYEIDSVYYIKPLLETISGKLKSALEEGLNFFIDREMVTLCFEGLHNCIRLTAVFGLHQERDAFMELLGKHAQISNGTLTDKNNFALRTIIRLGLQQGSFLRSAWRIVLQCISQLDEFKLLQSSGRASGVGSMTSLGITTLQQGGDSSPRVLKDGSAQQMRENATLPLQTNFDTATVERIYSNSVDLDLENMIEFIKALCEVSKKELEGRQPRTFTLLKIVSVVYCNMERIKYEWDSIWNVFKAHFTEVGCHQNQEIVISAVGLLLQMSVRFLGRQETFSMGQKEFLRPFEAIFLYQSQVPQTPSTVAIKERILTCLMEIVCNHLEQIKSGWRIIFNLIGFALQQENEILQVILKNLDGLNPEYNHYFIDLHQSLRILSKKKKSELALAAVDWTKQCLKFLYARSGGGSTVQVQQSTAAAADAAKKQADHIQELWVPMIRVFSDLAGDSRQEMQERGMTALFETLKEYGHMFNVEHWKYVFQSVLRPVFDEIQFTFQSKTSHSNEFSWLRHAQVNAFSLITDLINEYYDQLHILLRDFLKTYENSIQNTNEQLAKACVTAIRQTILTLGNKLAETEWEAIIQFFDRIFKLTTPQKLLDPVMYQSMLNLAGESEGTPAAPISAASERKNNEYRFILEECVTQCVAQYALISVVREVVIEKYVDRFSRDLFEKLQETIDRSYNFARQFNSQIQLRLVLYKNGFMSEIQQLPGLLKQEREAQSCTLLLKFKLYKKHQDSPEVLESLIATIKEHIRTLVSALQQLAEKAERLKQQRKEEQSILEQRLMRLSLRELNQKQLQMLVKCYTELEVEREVQNQRQVLVQGIFPLIHQLSWEELKPHAQEIYTLLLELTRFPSHKCLACLTCPLCKVCRKCSVGKIPTSENFDEELQTLLKKFFAQALGTATVVNNSVVQIK